MSNTAEIINFPNKTEQPGGRMADLSNGYTKVANEIQQLKPRLRLSGREWQCFEAVIWLTYGWNKKQDRVTNTVIAELTGLSDTHVSDALKSLAERKIIFSQKQGMMKIVGVNTDLTAWILDKPETGRKFPKTGKSFPKSGITFPKTVDTQYKNKNSIKRSSSENSGESSDSPPENLPALRAGAAVQTPKGDKWGTADDLKAAQWMFTKILIATPAAREPNWPAWANDVRLMRAALKASHREICEVFEWANADHFWKTNILSPAKLREKWPTLKAQMSQPGRNRQQQAPQQPEYHWNSREAWENEFL
ncbi:replication protein [Franconibacter daqui]|uniref:replication protein n=1 Tax=Franconibacter daqui TaxID=2047724 RepID=UPI002DB73FC1|nr:replication protein [Franconibacter daqui]MEB5922756.1 replication protein [Franconibacter daqui]